MRILLGRISVVRSFTGLGGYSLCLFRFLHLVEDDPSRPRFAREQHRVRMDVQYLHDQQSASHAFHTKQHYTYCIAPHGPVRPVRDPTRAVAPVPADEALAQTLCVALTALHRQAEALHVLFELRTDGDRAGHGAEGKRVRLAPGGRAAVAREGVIRCAQL